MVTFLMATMRLLGLHLDDAIDEEEGVAVGQEGHDFEDVHRSAGRWLLVGGGIGRGFGRRVGHGKDEYKRRDVTKRLLAGLK